MRINKDTKITFKKMAVEYRDNAAIDAVVSALDGLAIASEIGD